MKRDQLKEAADALGRLEALETARKDAERAPHSALPISFVSIGGADDDSKCGIVSDERAEYRTERYPLLSDHGTKAYYPRERYIATIEYLIAHERTCLESLGVKP